MVFDGSLFFSQQVFLEEIAFPHFPSDFKAFNEESYLRTVMRAFAIVRVIKQTISQKEILDAYNACKKGYG